MTTVVRAKTSTGDWCKPTTELPNGDLAQLLHRTRIDSSAQPAVIVDRPPVADPMPPVVSPAWHGQVNPGKQRHPREAIRRITDRLARLTAPRPYVYPTAPSSHTWVWPVVVAILAAVAIAMAIVRPF